MNWIKRRDATDNPSAPTYNLLATLDIAATYSHVNKTVNGRPDYPSLMSIAESLLEWGVRTEGVKGEVSDLSEVDYPSIIHLKDNAGYDFAVLRQLLDGQASIIHSKYGPSTITLDKFSLLWSGVLLRACRGAETGEPDYGDHLKAQRMNRIRGLLTVAGLPALLLLALGCGLSGVVSLSTLIPLVLTKTIGFVVCLVMVAASLGKGSILSSLCPMGRIANCHRVTQSSAGRMFGVSMAEWGMLYFGGGLVSLPAALYLGQFQSDLFLIGVLGLLVLPYTFFSVIYQAFVVRSWCWMYLAVQALFWAEFYLLFDTTFTPFGEGLPAVTFPISLLLGFGVVTLTWVALRNTIISARKAEALDHRLTRLRRQPDYIQMQLSKTVPADMGLMPFEVEVGPADARVAI